MEVPNIGLVENYLKLMLDANERINLTNIKSFDKGLLLHIEDSLTGYDYIQSTGVERLADIGSGCGFPGVALGITKNIDTTLIDSTSKKMNAVGSIINQMGLDDLIHPIVSRIEGYSRNYLEAERGSSYPTGCTVSSSGFFDYVTARALSSLPVVMELATPLIKPNGILIAYKANLSDEEMNHAASIEAILGLEMIEVKHIVLSDNITNRTLVIYKRIAEPSIDLPRRNGKAQQSPLKPV